jgi:putative tricarboxylic transport membrane protein
MNELGHLLSGFSTALTSMNLLSCFIGVVVGTLVGVLPGIGAVGTMAILLPITFSMGPIPAMIMLCGIFYGAQYGGSTTSILVNIPGEVGSIVTCLDGYQMAKQGRAGPALGISAMGSFIGGTLSIIGLMLLTPTLAKLAINFGPPELFSLVIFGLMMVTTIGRGSMVKSFIMTTLGLFVSTIGKESIKGFGRFTFGSFTLSDGLGLVPVAVGMFGIAELLSNIEEIPERQVFKTNLRNLFPSVKDWRDTYWPIIRGTVIGFFLGILPGGGTVITTFSSYALEKRLSKHPERFGAGAIEGVAGPETANNAATSGSMVPLLGLGVPPHVTMAMLLGAFIIHGIQPGPSFIAEHPDIFWGVVASMYIGNVMLLVLNLPLIGIWIQILKIPYRLLFPLIVLFCYVGVYSLNSNFYEFLIMIFFGVFGYLLRKLEYDAGPFLLAMVLGPMLETSFRQSMGMSGGDLGIFLRRPLSAGPLILVGVVIVIFAFLKINKEWKDQRVNRRTPG